MKNDEIWKDIEGYDGMYQVSNLGRVKSFKNCKERILSSGTTKKNYKFVILSKNDIRKNFQVHRLVAMTFYQIQIIFHKLIIKMKTHLTIILKILNGVRRNIIQIMEIIVIEFQKEICK